MNRLILAILAISLMPSGGRSDDKATVRVTGTVTLPKGEKPPPGAKVTVKVLFFRPSGMITFYSTIGSHEITLADSNKPIAFSVGISKSYTEKYAPDQFLMRATISVMDGNRSKTIYTTEDSDEVMPIDPDGKPKANVKIRATKASK